MNFPLRQQLSSDSLFLLENTAAKEIERLKRLHWDVVNATAESDGRSGTEYKSILKRRSLVSSDISESEERST